ncbi:MAG: AI-2E family transporter [Spirochaetes bacterium]|nr:AI-2E family transporter [Spirochaetota bacterium]
MPPLHGRILSKREIRLNPSGRTVIFLFIKKYYRYIVLGIILFLIIYFWQWFLILLFSFIMAYLLEPVVRLLERLKVRRIIAVILLLIFLFFLLYVFFATFVPFLMAQMKTLNRSMPDLIKQVDVISQSVKAFFEKYRIKNNDMVSAIFNKVEYFLTFITNAIFSTLLFLLQSIPYFIIVPILVFYFLKDKDEFTDYILRFFGKKRESLDILHKINSSIMGYIKGTFLDCFLVGVILTIGFYLFRLKYALFAGGIGGLFVIIPYIGPVIGMVPAILIAIIGQYSFHQMIGLTLFMVIVQLVNGYIIQPRIIGKVVDFHPLVVLFIVIIGTGLLGGIGLFLSIPAAIIIREIIRHFIPARA